MAIGKTLGVLASVASIGGFAFVVYDKTQIDPSREQLNRLTKLIETQEEQLEVQKKLVTAITSLNLDEKPLLVEESLVTNKPIERAQVESDCSIENPTHELVVHSVNVREGAPILGSLAPKSGIIFAGDRFKITDTATAGVLGFGAAWFEIIYCTKSNEARSGWIADKLKDGTTTNKTLQQGG